MFRNKSLPAFIQGDLVSCRATNLLIGHLTDTIACRRENEGVSERPIEIRIPEPPLLLLTIFGNYIPGVTFHKSLIEIAHFMMSTKIGQ